MLRSQGCVLRRLILRSPRLPAAGAIVPPKQPIHLDRRTPECVPPSPITRPEQDQPNLNQTAASVVEGPLPDASSKIGALAPDELAALRAFFELVSQWDESLKGEVEHE
jgi:hypothetical protein